MAYYSLVVLAPHPLAIPDPLIMLDAGVNTVTVLTDNLEELLQRLRGEGCEVKQVHRLDEFETPTAQDMALPGEVLDE